LRRDPFQFALPLNRWLGQPKKVLNLLAMNPNRPILSPSLELQNATISHCHGLSLSAAILCPRGCYCRRRLFEAPLVLMKDL
jgi:hypothetical protein